MNTNNYISKLKETGLKVTPQRVAILKVLNELNHPCADEIAEALKKELPGLSLATIYNNIETLVQKRLVSKVLSEDGKFRFDARQEKPHHLYEIDSGKIEDYFDDELNSILEEYFRNKTIPGFEIKDVKLQFKGKYISE